MWPFVRRNRLAPIERLHDSISALARDPVLFTDCGVADSFEGRFELLTLHLTLVLRRLAQMPAPAADVAQELADLSFLRFDEALREIGIGDIGVPKRMKIFARMFYGRVASYGEAIDRGDVELLAAALARNVRPGEALWAEAAELSAYVLTVQSALASQRLTDILAGQVAFPLPDTSEREELP